MASREAGNEHPSPQQHTDSPTAARIADAAHQTIDRAAAGASRAEQRVRAAADQAAEQVRDTGKEARQEAEALMRKAQSYVNEHPISSLAIAFAAGVLTTSLLRR